MVRLGSIFATRTSSILFAASDRIGLRDYSIPWRRELTYGVLVQQASLKCMHSYLHGSSARDMLCPTRLIQKANRPPDPADSLGKGRPSNEQRRPCILPLDTTASSMQEEAWRPEQGPTGVSVGEPVVSLVEKDVSSEKRAGVSNADLQLESIGSKHYSRGCEEGLREESCFERSAEPYST